MITAFLPWIPCQVLGFRCFVVLASVKTGVSAYIRIPGHFLLYIYRKSYAPGGLFFSNTFEEGWGGGCLTEKKHLCEVGEGGRLFNLAKTMVSVLHAELEYKVEKLKYKKLEVMQPMIKNKSELSAGK